MLFLSQFNQPSRQLSIPINALSQKVSVANDQGRYYNKKKEKHMNILERKTQPPKCPFCGQTIDPPQPLEDNFLYEFDGGHCSCGATYCFDPTARNGGAAMLQAMVQACKGDWDKAQNLSPDIDYLEGLITQYSALAHRVNAPGAYGNIYFIRLKSKK